MSAEPIDFAAVMAEHTRHWQHPRGYCVTQAGFADLGPCLPYRLAKTGSDLAQKVARVEAYSASKREFARRQAALNLRIVGLQWQRDQEVATLNAEADRIDAALADPPEQVQP